MVSIDIQKAEARTINWDNECHLLSKIYSTPAVIVPHFQHNRSIENNDNYFIDIYLIYLRAVTPQLTSVGFKSED